MKTKALKAMILVFLATCLFLTLLPALVLIFKPKTLVRDCDVIGKNNVTADRLNTKKCVERAEISESRV